MAILCETGKCMCCSLRAGVQVAAVLCIVFSAMSVYSSGEMAAFWFSDADDWSSKYKSYLVDCEHLTGKTFAVQLSKDDGSVKDVKLPSIMKALDVDESLGEYDHATWKLTKVENFDDDTDVWPPQGKKDDASLQLAIQNMATTCSSKKPTTEALRFTFDWQADPRNEKEMANATTSAVIQQAHCVYSIIINVAWLVLSVYLGWIVFGSEDGIISKKEQMTKLRFIWLITFCISFVVDASLIGIYAMKGRWFIMLDVVNFIICKSVSFCILVFIDNLNDVVQAGGSGIEGLPASKLDGLNAATPLLTGPTAEVTSNDPEADKVAEP